MSEGRTQGWLRFRADRRTIGFAALWFALVAVQWVAIPYTWIDLLPAPFGRAAAWTWWTWPKAVGAAALLALTCLLSFVGAVSSHNVMHCPMFRRPWMNDAWRFVQSLWCGQPVSVFVPVHNHGHHKYAQSRKDLTRSTKFDTGWQLTNLVRATQWRNAALRDCIRYFDALRVRGGRRWKEPLVEAAVLLSAYAVLAVVDGRRWMTLVLVPHSVGMFCIKAINFLQHDGCSYDNDGYDHSRNFTGPWFNWVFLNNGFHTVHHMLPGLHWSLAPAKHAALVAPHIHPALDVAHFGPFAWRFLLWPGRRERYDGAPYEGQPGGEGSDLPWAEEVVGGYAPEPAVEVRRAG